MKNTESNELDTESLLEACSELKRGLSRLSFVGMGLSGDLDKELAQLRKIIKHDADVSEIKISLDGISKILRTLDDDQDEQAIANANSKLDVLTLLLKKELPSALRSGLKSVKKKAKSKDASEIMRSIADVIGNYVSDVESAVSIDEKSGKKKSGFFSSLFSKNDDEKIDFHENNNANEMDNDATKEPLTEKLLGSYFPQDVKDSLQHLIDQLSSMDGYAVLADSLNEEISKIFKIEQISAILEMITSAFIEISDQEHVQFEKFLKTLNVRIKRVNDFIEQTLEFSQSTSSDSQQLNTDLTGNLSNIKNSLTSAKTLDEAKDAVFDHMDTIVGQINEYCSKQESNSDELVSKMDQLTEQLRATEDEASRLKDDLAEQRVRAQTDPLTSLPNRYSYNERLTQEYNRWRRYRNSLALVIADIDFFKRVNDDHGHAFGDLVLKEIAAYLGAGVRESDFIARFGGEEFVILLPETEIADATRAMNKLRVGIAKMEIKDGDNVVPVTMSFGISVFENDDTTKTVFERADKALYRAKEKGRNLVCCQRGK